MGTIYILFKELRKAVEDDGSWNGEHFVRSEAQQTNIDELFEQIGDLLAEETNHLVGGN
tara:strand:+ start:239 stop:415 length:177 start_codon:yes stop_codon:yes gene_type:complete